MMMMMMMMMSDARVMNHERLKILPVMEAWIEEFAIRLKAAELNIRDSMEPTNHDRARFKLKF